MDSHALIRSLDSAQLKKAVADVRVGDTVKVHYKIREGNKERVQVFLGLVIATKAGKTVQGSFTARKVVSGIGVERTFPLHSPWIVKIERVKTGKVRRAKLNFVRQYANSSRFKLKDKGKEGTVWEDIAEQQEQVEEAKAEQEAAEVVAEEVAPVAETTDNTADDSTAEDSGNGGGDPSGEPAGNEEVSDSKPESSN